MEATGSTEVVAVELLYFVEKVKLNATAIATLNRNTAEKITLFFLCMSQVDSFDSMEYLWHQ